MRKLLTLLAALLLAISAFAVPARRTPFSYKQPDGTVVRLQRHGDEFFSWTTLAGTSQVVELAADGFWRPSTLSAEGRQAGKRRRAQANALRPRTHDESNTLTHGERHIPVLLVAFSDVDFTLSEPTEKFSALLNERGYSANGATGSVQDFYLDNSDGQFKPVFDVYGPVTLPHEMAYYGRPVKNSEGKITANDVHAELALYDGCLLLDEQIDFSRYDYDNDGNVDMTLFYYAGHNTAEGGSEDAIWPHQWYLTASSDMDARNNRFDGKRVNRYFCTSELKGSDGDQMCGIGTTCHEFGHSLGLPDFYDTDDDNEECSALFAFSTMCGGNYNNDGRTPPWFNAEERIILGWMTGDDILDLSEGAVTIGPVRNSAAYMSETGIEGEYFLYECRDGYGWDEPLPTGLLVYHVDKSEVRRIDGYTPYELWSYTNSINAYGLHPCFYVVPAADQSNLNYAGDMASCVFPGSSSVKSFIPMDWNGTNRTGLLLTDISYADGQVQFTVAYSQERQIFGRVTDLTGHPLSGVLVQLSAPASAFAAPRVMKAGLRNTDHEAVSDDSGEFRISLEGFDHTSGHLTLSKQGYRTTGFDVPLTERINRAELQLSRNDQGAVTVFSYYDPEGTIYYYGDGATNSMMAAIRIPAAELPSTGGTLAYVNFPPIWEADSYYIIVDEGGQRICTQPYQPASVGGKQKVDVEVPITGSSDLYVGVAVKNARPDAGYEGYLFEITEGDGHCHLSRFDLTASHWGKGDYALVLDACVIEKTEAPAPDTFATLGIPCISDPLCGSYTAGSNFSLQMEVPEGYTASTVQWSFDGRDVTGAKSVSLTAGEHVVVARVKWADGTQESLSLIIVAK